MKGTSPFPVIHVAADEMSRYQRQVQQLLDDALREFDQYGAARKNGKNPLQDKWQWKPLKTHEALNVYKERQPTHPELNPLTVKSSTGSASGSSRSIVSDKPSTTGATKAIAMAAAYTPEMALSASSSAVTMSVPFASVALTGHINGTLSDVMYGLVATDTSDLQVRSRFMTDSEEMDAAMLTTIQSPSDTDPFQFLGLQWMVRGEPSRSKSSGKGIRDFVVLVASGVVRHKASDSTTMKEIGYYICHSVDLPECGELLPLGHGRGWMSTCALFTPSKTKSAQVSVFARGFVDFKGKMADYQAANMTTTLMLAGVAEAASCGQNKKLSWLLYFKGAAAEFRRMQPESVTRSNRCGICDRKFGVLNSVASCSLCQAKMCSKCRVSRELSFVSRGDAAASVTQSTSWDEGLNSNAQVRSLSAVLCKNCIMSSGNLDARVMARREIMSAGSNFSDTATTAAWTDSETPVPRRLNSPLSSTQSGSEQSFATTNPFTSSKMRFWTPGSDAAALQGRSGRPDKQKLPYSTNDLVGKAMTKSKKSSEEAARAKLQSSIRSSASTVPSPRDQDQEQRFELATRQPRHQPRYIEEEPVIEYVYKPQHEAASRNDLVRRMEQLNMAAETVYQFTSKMNASTHCRMAGNSSTSIQELD